MHRHNEKIKHETLTKDIKHLADSVNFKGDILNILCSSLIKIALKCQTF